MYREIHLSEPMKLQLSSCVAGCSSHVVVMLYGVGIEMETFRLAVLVTCYSVRVLDWCAGVWAKIIVLWPLQSVCSCLFFSDSSLLLFF